VLHLLNRMMPSQIFTPWFSIGDGRCLPCCSSYGPGEGAFRVLSVSLLYIALVSGLWMASVKKFGSTPFFKIVF